MISTTFNSESVWLWPYPPDKYQVDCEFSFITSHSIGLTKREAREIKDTGMRRKISFKAYLNPANYAQYKTAIAAWSNKKVLVPFWPSQRNQSDTDTGSHGGMIRGWWYEPMSGGSFHFQWNGSTPETTPTGGVIPGLQTAPMMLCEFESLPEVPLPVYGGGAYVTVKFIEVGDSTTEIIETAETLTNGPTINGGTPPKLTIGIDWQSRKITETVNIRKENIGFGKAPATNWYQHQPRETHSINVTGVGRKLNYLLNLFKTSQGSVKPWWIPTEYSESTLLYGRFKDDVLKVRWVRAAFGADEMATCSFQFQSLPTEEVLPSGETFGTTTGPVNAGGRFFGIKVFNQAQEWYFTSNSASVVGPGGHTFTPRQIERGDIEEGLNLDIPDMDLTVVDFDGNPFLSMIQNPNGENLWVTIYEGLLSSPSTADVVFIGRAVKPDFDGSKMKIAIRSFTSFMEKEGPRQGLTTSCGASCFDAKCGLNPASFTTTKTLSGSSAGTTAIFTSTIFLDHTMLGYVLTRTLPSGEKQTYVVMDNTSSGGHLSCQLDTPISPAPTGDEAGWTILQVCDQTYDTCTSIFGNEDNFRGVPRMPNTNPSVFLKNSTNGQGKK